MKTKQLVAIIVACAVFIVTGITGIIGAFLFSKTQESTAKSITDSFSSIFSKDIEIETPAHDYIGQIDIVGSIEGSENSDFSSFTSTGYDHDYYISFINKMMDDDYNKGIFLYVSSPGGTVYHSDEMYLKLMQYKETTKRPVYAYFADSAFSGAYYISMAADKIYENRNGWTGSIGVIVSLINYKELFDKLGVKEIDIVSADNKTIGSATKDMTPEQEAIFQSLVDEAYDQFVGIVSTGRKMKKEDVIPLADGRIYSAMQAKNAGLIDEIKSIEDTKAEITDELSADIFVPKRATSGFLKLIYGVSGNLRKSSDSDLRAVQDFMENDESGVLMYYAK